MKPLEKEGYIIIKYEDGYWITWWSNWSQKRMKHKGPYKNKVLAQLDLEIIEQNK